VKGAAAGDMKIPLKPKKKPIPHSNGAERENGKRPRDNELEETLPTKRPRPNSSEYVSVTGKASIAAEGPFGIDDDDVVVVDDDHESGAIIIEDY